MALRAAARNVLQVARRGTTVHGFSVQQSMAHHAIDARSFSIFSEPSFPVQKSLHEPQDVTMLMDKFAKMDPSELWKVGSFPLQAHEGDGFESEEYLYDITGMLSSLDDDIPLRETMGIRSVGQLLLEMDIDHGYYADSVLKKRRKKMNKHKHRKRRKSQRMRTKKN
jgi:hypothetical protein